MLRICVLWCSFGTSKLHETMVGAMPRMAADIVQFAFRYPPLASIVYASSALPVAHHGPLHTRSAVFPERRSSIWKRRLRASTAAAQLAGAQISADQQLTPFAAPPTQSGHGMPTARVLAVHSTAASAHRRPLADPMLCAVVVGSPATSYRFMTFLHRCPAGWGLPRSAVPAAAVPVQPAAAASAE